MALTNQASDELRSLRREEVAADFQAADARVHARRHRRSGTCGVEIERDENRVHAGSCSEDAAWAAPTRSAMRSTVCRCM